ncbi:metalloregulator ArsR/SmtB family transcription factor [Alcanivorax sp. DP30]|uniref:ArsR/SmtB family transcription factor n=1 Tax=Alcanivorax sp. DP30 TaxID=2606217 RepID=UPI00136C7287|nr:metalloregulator ArsR/SmtB family transcription factor [Alcanivorax sp. DP30]MZR63286.1 metalloregulator ArsR/SmtB family transcription factor [Alcanivorax sp. DP30]
MNNVAANSSLLPDAESLRANASDASQMLKALSHPDRLMLLCQMADGSERSVSELEILADLHQPSLSQQIGVLRREGLIEGRRDGKHMFYRVADPRALAILHTLYEQFCGAS